GILIGPGQFRGRPPLHLGEGDHLVVHDGGDAVHQLGAGGRGQQHPEEEEDDTERQGLHRAVSCGEPERGRGTTCATSGSLMRMLARERSWATNSVWACSRLARSSRRSTSPRTWASSFFRAGRFSSTLKM